MVQKKSEFPPRQPPPYKHSAPPLAFPLPTPSITMFFGSPSRLFLCPEFYHLMNFPRNATYGTFKLVQITHDVPPHRPEMNPRQLRSFFFSIASMPILIHFLRPPLVFLFRDPPIESMEPLPLPPIVCIRSSFSLFWETDLVLSLLSVPPPSSPVFIL